MAAERPSEAQIAPGHGETLEALFLALEGPLLAYARRLVRNPEMAEDIVQEAFLRLQAEGARVREPRAWLPRAVRNLALNQLRAAAKIVPLPGISTDATEALDAGGELTDVRPLPDEQLARMEAVGLVRLGLEALDSRSRELVRLKFGEELSYREIGDRTGLTVGHVGYLLHHAVKSLAADLAKAGLLP